MSTGADVVGTPIGMFRSTGGKFGGPIGANDSGGEVGPIGTT